MEPLKNKVYFDGLLKIRVYGVRQPDLSMITSKFMLERMKRFIQVQILFIDELFWINILPSELVKVKQ